MNRIVKILAPTTLALAAFGAQAGTIETDYPAGVPAVQHTSAQTTGQQGWGLQQPISEAPARFSTDSQQYTPRSRDAVRMEAQQPRKASEQPFA